VDAIIDDLVSLGYTEYEARVYLALVEHPEVSGYEASKHSGVPRSRVYEVLGDLVDKGAALQMSVDDRNVYRPLPYRALLEKHRQKTSTTLDRLEKRLAALPRESEEYSFFALSGRDAVMAHAREMIESTQHTVFVSCWPQELELLDGPLQAARDRGVIVATLVYEHREEGVGQVGGTPYFYHSVTPMQFEQVAQLGRWLLVAADNLGVAIAQLKEGSEVALCADNRLLAFLVAQTVAHDIHLMELFRCGGKDYEIPFDEETQRRIQAIQRAASRLG